MPHGGAVYDANEEQGEGGAIGATTGGDRVNAALDSLPGPEEQRS
jgi:hypothetical protein